MSDPLFNGKAVPRVVRIGRAGEAVVSIDGAAADPAGLVDRATVARFAPPDPDGGYPGARAPAPADLTAALVDFIDPVIRSTYPVGEAQAARTLCNFSLVTLAPAALAPLQRLPHIDTPDPLRFAVLVYLCPATFGGTAFYRQRATGLERVGPADHPAYRAARQHELAALVGPPAYPHADTAGYAQTAAFAARPNRLLLYRSCALHSGIIPPESRLSADPRHGRLTLNLFVDYRH